MWELLKNKLSEAPVSILVIALILNAIGLLSLYSVTIHQDLPLIRTSFLKQCLWLFPALTALLTVLLLPRRIIHKYAFLLFGGVLLLLFVPFLREPVAGTYRWISIGAVNFQPSEYAKLLIIIVLARFLSHPRIYPLRFTGIAVPIIIALIPAVIIVQQPDLGTALIVLSPVLVMLYWAGARPFHLFLLLAPIFSILNAFNAITFWIWSILLLLVLYLSRPRLRTGVVIFFTNVFLGLLAPWLWNSLKPYQQNRILTLFNPDMDPLGAAYQVIQSQTAIGSGGFWGKGWGAGTQTQLKFLPVQETDFIISVIGEEFGFLMLVLILALFFILFYKMTKLAYESNDKFSSLVIIGICVILVAHMFVNIAMSVGLIPVKGLPMPFISYGGSFLLSCYIMIGLVMNLSINYPE